MERTLLRLGLLLLIVSILIWNGCGNGNASDGGNSAGQDSSAVAQDDSTNEDTADKKAKDKGKKTGKHKSEEDDEDNAELDYVPVEIEEALIGDITKHLLLSASLKTEEQVSVYPEATGIVRQFMVDEGDRVAEGDTLLILDDEEKKIDRDEAHVTFLEKKASYDIAIELRKQNLNSKEELDLAKFNKERAKFAFERAELELRRTSVLAPISGYIAERKVNRGDLTNMQSELFRIVNPADMIASVHIPEAELPYIDKTKPVIVVSDVYPSLQFKARIKRISPVIDAASGTFRITIGVENDRELLRPGMFVSVKVVTDVHEDVVLVPKESVIFENDLPYVFMVQDSIALKLPLKRGYDDSKYIEAIDLIKEGDKIVTVGQTGLKDSAKVKIIDMKEIQKKAREMAEANGNKLRNQQ